MLLRGYLADVIVEITLGWILPTISKFYTSSVARSGGFPGFSIFRNDLRFSFSCQHSNTFSEGDAISSLTSKRPQQKSKWVPTKATTPVNSSWVVNCIDALPLLADLQLCSYEVLWDPHEAGWSPAAPWPHRHQPPHQVGSRHSFSEVVINALIWAMPCSTFNGHRFAQAFIQSEAVRLGTIKVLSWAKMPG